MRKINSDFKTAFLSEAGSELLNNDYFAFVELDEYACYVIADGLNSYDDGADAKLAIQTIIKQFEEKPSIKKHHLQNYLFYANQKLLKSGRKHQGMKASVTVIVSDYESIRYAVAGNTRLYLYRGDQAYIKSRDTSLAEQLREVEDSARDKLARHIERNNLYTYLGQRKWFEPYCSAKIKLKESDVITLFSRGIWEHLDDGELLDIFSEASLNQQETIDTVEELLLSKQPEQLDNYTMAVIFINKVFCDPNRKKKRKKIIMIAIMVLVLLIGITVALLLWNRSQRQKREAMDTHFHTTISRMENHDFVGAEESAKEAEVYAKKLKDQAMMAEIGNYLLLIQTIIRGDSLLRDGDFREAQATYLRAQTHSAEVGNAAQSYLEGKLETTEQYIHFHENMNFGDSLLDLGNYEMALSMYNEAKRIASSLYFSDGKKQAIDAITLVYERMAIKEEEKAALEDEKQASAQENSDQILLVSNLIAQGDDALANGDFHIALTYYNIASVKNQALSDETMQKIIDLKIDLANKKILEQQNQEQIADDYEQKGDDYERDGDFVQAKHYYQLALQKAKNLALTDRISELEMKLAHIEKELDRERNSTISQDPAA